MADAQQDEAGPRGAGDRSGTVMADSILVSPTTEDESQGIENNPDTEQQIVIAGDVGSPSTREEVEAPGTAVHSLAELRDSILHNSLRSSTHKSYDSKERKWLKFCRIHNIDPHNQGTDVFLNFLAWIFRNKGKWGYIKGFPPALAKYFNNKYIDRTQVSWMLKGIFNLRPPVSRYTAIWDVNIVLHYIAAMIVDNYKDRVRKMAILLMLLSGNRVNMLSHFKVSNMFITNNECTFVFDEALKTSRPNWNTDPWYSGSTLNCHHSVQSTTSMITWQKGTPWQGTMRSSSPTRSPTMGLHRAR